MRLAFMFRRREVERLLSALAGKAAKFVLDGRAKLVGPFDVYAYGVSLDEDGKAVLRGGKTSHTVPAATLQKAAQQSSKTVFIELTRSGIQVDADVRASE